MRLGLFGSAAPRVRSALAPESAITKRDLPAIMPPAWLVEKARAQGVDPMLEWEAMQQGSGPAVAPPPAKPAATPPLGMMGRGPQNKFMAAAQGAMAAPAIAPQTTPQPAPAMAPTMGGAAQPQVKAGMQMAAQDMAARPQKLGAFGNGPAPAAAAKPVGLWDEVWADPFTFFMTGTEGLDRKYGRAAEEAAAQKAAVQKAEFEKMIAGLPPEQQMLWMTNPEEMAKAMASNYEAANVGAGETRYLGGTGGTYTAPKTGFEGATPYAQTFADGKLTTTFGDNRPISYSEEETLRHNRATEGNADARLAFDRSKPAGAGGELTPYQMYQIGRNERNDAREVAGEQATARTSITNIQEGQTRVQGLIDHPGFKGIYGNIGLGNAKPLAMMNQDELNAMALLDQIGGEAFLAGVEKMRGTGPLSDNEGKRVMQAVTRLTNRLQDPASAKAAAEEFMASLQRLEEAVAQESGLQSMIPRLQENSARVGHAGSILGGTGEFNPAAFQGLAPAAPADYSDDEILDALGLR